MGPPRKRVREDSSDASDEEQLESIYPEDVTIAIFCALVEETAAVQETFDEELVCSSGVTGKAKYVYSFGRIGDHNVVIAQPVDMGTVNTALCAATVSQQFTNVRFALMVGIGAGIPSNKIDIRLGDVAISVPRDDHPGVIQYDFGKYESDGRFVRKGTMDKPPPILISAIRSLEVDEFRNKTPIRKILRRLIRQQSKFARPEKDDVLYDDAFPHQSNGQDCSDCQNASDARIVDRSPRSTVTLDQPYIHRGLILSGSGVIKNPEDRNSLRRGYENAICFEMEAAGIMNEIPCLVIRGIGDYADTHKQGGWHNYAAAAAAAYCKAVLLKVPGEEVTETAPMRELMNIVNRSLQTIHAKVEVLRQDVHLDRIRRWLSPPDPSTNFNRARELHHERTGDWLVTGDMYTAWKQEPNSCIWLNGIAGCGKTILSSSVVADLNQNRSISHSLVYFYFDFNETEKQSYEKALRSLIIQLYEKRQSLRKIVDTLYSTCHEGGHQPSLESLCTLFQDMIQEAGEVWIVLDALDECPTRNAESAGGLLPWIHRLRDANLNIHLLVTSRPEQDIKAAIERFTCVPQNINLQSDLVADDINAYIVTKTKEMGRWKTYPDVQQEIMEALIARADGMFRWAACQFNVLEKCLDRPSIRRNLANLPRTLGETYTRALEGIEDEYRHHTNRLLQFLLYSKEPLRLEEAVDALAVDTTAPQHARFDPSNRMPVPEEILRCCSSLVVLYKQHVYGDDFSRPDPDTEMTTYIRLAHFSVQEYLLSDPTMTVHYNEITSRTEIVDVCLSYLLRTYYFYIQEEYIQNVYEEQRDNIRLLPELYPFLLYSAQNWAKNAKVVELSNNATLGSVEAFFLLQGVVGFSSCIYPPDGNDFPSPENISALYYVSCVGLVYSTMSLLKSGAPVNEDPGATYTPLQAASKYGHESIVELLLEKGAEIDACAFGYSALHLASNCGQESIVKLLLEKGAATNIGPEYETPLCAAVEAQHVSIATLLLEKGANVGCALHVAAGVQNVDLIHLFLNHGADVNKQDTMGSTPMHETTQLHVMMHRGTGIMESLFRSGADVNFADKSGLTPLMIAAQQGAADAIRFLLQHGANPYSLDMMGQTAFDYAVKSERETKTNRGQERRHRRYMWHTSRDIDFCAIKVLLETGVASGGH